MQHPQRRLLRPARGRSARCRAAPARVAVRVIVAHSSGSGHGARRRAEQRRRGAPAPRRAPSSGASQRSGPGPGTPRRAARRSAAPVPAPAASGARRSSPRAGADQLDGEDPRAGWRPTGAACAPRPSPSTRGPPASRWSAASRRWPGAASRRFSATIAACVYWAIIRPELTPASVGEERRQARASGSRSSRRSVRRSAIAPTSAAAIARKSHDEAERRAVEVAARLDAAVGQDHRVVDRRAQLGVGDRAGVGDRVARGAVHLRRAAQRVGVLHAGVARRGGWPRSAEPASSRRRFAALAAWPGCGRSAMQVGGEGAVGAEQRLDATSPR